MKAPKEVSAFRAKAASIRKRVREYVASGDVLTATKGELRLFAARDRLADAFDALEREGLATDETRALFAAVRREVSAAPEAAREARTARNEAALRAIRESARDEDPYLRELRVYGSGGRR